MKRRVLAPHTPRPRSYPSCYAQGCPPLFAPGTLALVLSGEFQGQTGRVRALEPYYAVLEVGGAEVRVLLTELRRVS